MLSNNLNRESASDTKAKSSLTLTKNGVWRLKDIQFSRFVKDNDLILQVLSVKPINNNKFPSKWNLSDGISSIIAMKMVQCDVYPNQFDVIKLSCYQMREMNNKIFLIVMNPVTIEKSGLKAQIGNPQSIEYLKANQAGVNFDQTFGLPKDETVFSA